MRNIYTFGGHPAKRNLTVSDLQAGKGQRKFTETTVDTVEEAAAAASAGIDTLTCNACDVLKIREGAPETFLTAALGFTDYHTKDDILRGAMKAVEDGADMVFTSRSLATIEMLARDDIPVMSHTGLIPRKSTWVGGLRAVGKTAEEAYRVLEHMKALEDAGACAVEVEVMPQDALAAINPHTSLITFSIGAGSGGDVMFLFMDDICGLTEKPARHARAFGHLAPIRDQIQAERVKAMTAFRQDVETGAFPSGRQAIPLASDEQDKLADLLANV